MRRRNFIKNLSLGSVGVMMPQLASAVISNSHSENKPIVLSTWNFGKKANELAWAILSKEGNALDAVEQGVRIIEADPMERSVGYGGRPDRDGIVTLDACIMDEKSNIGAVAALENIG